MDDFAFDPAAPEGDAPILLGEALEETHDFAAPPADDQFDDNFEGEQFVGTVDETPADGGFDAPIVLGAPDEFAFEEPVVEEAEEEEEVAIVPLGPSIMQKWNEDWQTVLIERKDAENAKKAELIENADVAMKTFHQQRESKRDGKMAKNRSDEQEKLEAIEADLENDNSWQRVCKMVELSHDSSDVSADVKRMRDTMILLKNEPNRATVLA
jgi:hypothetical protein